jgi:hypothetical protein
MDGLIRQVYYYPYRVQETAGRFPRVVAALQPWAEISDRLRRFSTEQYSNFVRGNKHGRAITEATRRIEKGF